ncbi:MAG: amidohydrolase family protein [Gemmatimonadales bacterium]
MLGWAELNLQAQVRAPAPDPVAVTHVTVIAMTGAEPAPNQTVLIEGRRIVAVGSTSEVPIPPGTRLIDGHGAFVIPGLWDMHIHLAGDRETRRVDFPLFIANGVTGVRDMWGDCTSPCASDNPEDTAGFAPPAATVQAWKRDIAKGLLLGPRLVTASNVLEGPKPYWPGTRAIHDTTEARQAVEAAARKGADFIKIYDGLEAQPYFTVLRTARALRLPVVGHLPQVSLVTASDSGQKGLEHLAGILRACTRDSAGVAAARARYVQDTVPASKWAASRVYAELMVATFDEKACAPTFAHFVRNKTWQTPTLTVTRSFGLMSDSAFRADQRVRYTPPRLRARWEPGHDFRLRGVTADYYTSFQKILEGSYRAVLALHRAGVPILAGSDVRNAYVFPGFGLHDELTLLVAAGLTPRAALEAATVAPARFLEATDSMGTIEPGKVADLVLLAGNPLQDIGNTQRILAVVSRGLYFDRAALDRLLTSAEQAAQRR